MAILKCKMCGGNLEITEGMTVCECEYCGSRQTVPTADNEKKMNLFARANRLRFNCEFDKAAGIYESIVSEFPEEAEAYWGLLLCKYGIEYVDDPATGKKIPTCHRSSFESVMEDENFELACEYADATAKRVYREQAKEVEELRKGIIEVSSKEEPYDIFICYKETDENGDRTLDSVLAQDIYTALTEKGYRVFFSRITLEDKLGQEYEPYIFAALHSAKVMLAVGTEYEYYDAVWVKNEWSRYLQLISAGEKKTLIPCYKNLDAYDMPKEFARLQAQDMSKIGAMQDLLRGIIKILGSKSTTDSAEIQVENNSLATLKAQIAAMLNRGFMAIEDADFSKADSFFEQALNIDANCGLAYWGKVFCSKKAQSIGDLLSIVFSDIKYKQQNERVVISGVDIVLIARECDKSYRLLDEFDDQDLDLLLHDLKQEYEYTSFLQYYTSILQRLQNQGLSQFVSDTNYDRALKYADERVQRENKELLDNLLLMVQDRIKQEMRSVEREEKKAENREQFAYDTIKKRMDSLPIIECEEQERIDNLQKSIERYENEYKEKLTVFIDDYQNRIDSWEVINRELNREKSEYEDRIHSLELEKESIKGLFSGKRKKEIDQEIDSLKTTVSIIQNKLCERKPPQKDEELSIGEKLLKSDIDIVQMPEKKVLIKYALSEKHDGIERNNNETGLDENEYLKRLQNQRQIVLDKLYTKMEERKNTLRQLQSVKKAICGNTVTLGIYPLDNEKILKPLSWRVLAIEDNLRLLITKDCIDCMAFGENNIWQNSNIKKWLNSDFIMTAFNSEVQSRIKLANTEPQNEFSENERVFLLTLQQASSLFKWDSDRIAKPTPYAAKKCRYISSGNCRWWLSTKGVAPSPRSWGVASVEYDGAIYKPGYPEQVKDNCCVRPAIWIDVSDLE